MANTSSKRTPPSIAELTRGYLERCVTRPVDVPTAGLFEPYEVSASFRPEPRMAWNEARFGLTLADTHQSTSEMAMPNDWNTLVQRRDTIAAVACCVGNFPQLLQDIGPLMSVDDLTMFRPDVPGLPTSEPKLTGTPTERIVRAALARLEGDFDAAQTWLDSIDDDTMTSLIANERAAVAWHRGDWDTAIAIWNDLPESPMIAFNRGMAALFSGNVTGAIASLGIAVDGLPAESGWQHLANLYLALARIHLKGE